MSGKNVMKINYRGNTSLFISRSNSWLIWGLNENKTGIQLLNQQWVKVNINGSKW